MRDKILLSFLVLVVIVAAGVYLGAQSPALASSSAANDQPQVRTITVNGSGKVTLSPNMANISIGVQTENENASKAVSANNTQAQKVITALKNAGIPAEKIRTTDFSIYPRQEYNQDGEVERTTYVVNNTVYITVNDLTKVGGILDTAVQAGANNISGIQFDVTDRSEANKQALQAAVQNAHSRAEIIAEAAEVGLGAVQSIQSFISGGEAVMYRNVMAQPAAPAEVPISPGQMDITVEVTVVYEIAPK
jgi:uncharacterized protein YggE